MFDLIFIAIGQFFSDMGFIIRIFLLVAILGFLNQHIENKILKTIVAIFMVFITVFVDWKFYGTLYFVYAILGMGISSMVVDYFFMGNMGEEHGQQGQEQGNPLGFMPGRKR